MNSSIVATMPHPSPPELLCSRDLWQRLILSLRERGLQGRRESGAFLLGTRSEGQSQVLDFALYDDLDPGSLDRGIVHFDGRYYGALWELCRRSGHMVVADVHTHPFGTRQSESDREHPMIAACGHIALIIPRFARRMPSLRQIGMYRYLGARRWHTVLVRDRANFLRIDNGATSS
jgi:proteasome lid subunit RPN8/RPN11